MRKPAFVLYLHICTILHLYKFQACSYTLAGQFVLEQSKTIFSCDIWLLSFLLFTKFALSDALGSHLFNFIPCKYLYS